MRGALLLLGGLVGALLVAGAAALGGEDPGGPAAGVPADFATVRGVVRCREGRPVPLARVTYGESPRRPGHSALTGPTGAFVLTDLPRRAVNLRVTLQDVPNPEGRPHLRTWVEVDEQDAVLEIDLDPQLVVRTPGMPFTRQRFPEHGIPARLYGTVGGAPGEAPAGAAEGEVHCWVPVLEDGAMRFRRVPAGRPWTLWIPWTKGLGGTCYLSGPRLEVGEKTVRLEPGREISGTVAGAEDTVFPGFWTGPPCYGVVARRGPVEIRSHPRLREEGGRFDLGPLASGPWILSLYNVEEKRGFVGATVRVEAGAAVRLEPVASREAYDAARHGR